MKAKVIDITPDPSLLTKVSKQNYTTSQAIAELVDNSIDSRTHSRQLHINVQVDYKDGVIVVEDDGEGMDQETAENSLRLGHSLKVDKLGRYGLGLKAGASSLGKKFIIETTQKGSTKVFVLTYDEENWEKEKNWKSQIVVKNSPKDKSGTKITIEEIKVSLHNKLPTRVQEQLALRFAPFINSKEKVEIKVNGEVCKPAEPKLVKTKAGRKKEQEKHVIEEKVESGHTIKGWVGILKKGGANTGEYGLKAYHRGRLINPYAKIGFSEHPENRRITGEVHLDHVPVTNNKTSFIEESVYWEELNEKGGIFWKAMQPFVKEVRAQSKRLTVPQSNLKQLSKNVTALTQTMHKLEALSKYNLPKSIETKDLYKAEDTRSCWFSRKGDVLTVSINFGAPGYSDHKDKVSFGLTQVASAVLQDVGEKISFQAGTNLVATILAAYKQDKDKLSEAEKLKKEKEAIDKRLEELEK